LTNGSILQNPMGLKVAVVPQGGTKPLVVTDSSWRVSSGMMRNFSEVNYYTDPAFWTSARDMGGAGANPGWTPATGDSATRLLSTTHSYDGSGNYPTSQYTLFRDNRVITVTSPTSIKIAYSCDDLCTVYLDGNVVANGASSVGTSTLILTEGSHRFGVVLGNTSGPSNFIFAAIRTSDSYILTSTDASWSAANFWSATNPASSSSYDNKYFPVPDPRNINVLVVAGGGSGGGSTGGGGGAGGVVSTALSLGVGSYPVVVGAGGAASGNQASGRSGTNSTFGGITAIGGGGGGYSRGNGSSGGGLNGGSGGGSQDYGGVTIAGLGTALQGNPGGALGNASASGGGGAGGAGLSNETANIGGIGGIGVSSSISGTSKYYGGGGGGGNTGVGGLGGGGTSPGVDAGGAGTANTGGGGAGGWSYTAGNGGVGGSGVVIISYPTGLLTATGGTMTTSGGNTIHTFNGNGTFTITAVNG
jgi:hypothetical protein